MAEFPDKAYNNPGFLNSASARPVRILSEYLEPNSRLAYHKIRDTIVFFGSARFVDRETAEGIAASAEGADEVRRAERSISAAKYYEDAREVARLLTEWSGNLAPDGRRFVVCSGGGGGIMEAANRGASEAGGPSVGFNISLPNEQQPNEFITNELSFQFHYFFMRKLWFAYLAKAMIVFPGGYGTLDEMMEILTLVQTRRIRKPVLVALYGSESWKKVINFDAMEELGVIDSEDRKLFHYFDDPKEAATGISSWLTENYL